MTTHGHFARVSEGHSNHPPHPPTSFPTTAIQITHPPTLAFSEQPTTGSGGASVQRTFTASFCGSGWTGDLTVQEPQADHINLSARTLLTCRERRARRPPHAVSASRGGPTSSSAGGLPWRVATAPREGAALACGSRRARHRDLDGVKHQKLT
jgi:hypothetical protein